MVKVLSVSKTIFCSFKAFSKSKLFDREGLNTGVTSKIVPAPFQNSTPADAPTGAGHIFVAQTCFLQKK